MTIRTTANEDIRTVKSVFDAFAGRDLAGLSTFDDPQVALFAVEDGRVHSVEQYVGDPASVTAFWA